MVLSAKKARLLEVDAASGGEGDAQTAAETPLEKSSKATRRKKPFWEQTKGWSRIEVGDELLVGSEEGGFVGLEELTPTEGLVFDDSQTELIEAPMVSNDDPPAKNRASKRKQPPGSDTPGAAKEEQPNKVGKKPKKSAEAVPGDRIAQLQVQLAQLQQENTQLKAAVSKGGTADALGTIEEGAQTDAGAQAGQPGSGEKPLNHKQRKKIKRAALLRARRQEHRQLRKLERKSGKDAAPQDGDPIAEDLSAAAEEAGPIAEEAAGEGELHDTGVDVSTWDPFNLYAEVRGALARLGFSQPTPIQQECLPAAIRDRRDIIGAAQTGSGKTLAFGLPIIQALLEERSRADPAAAVTGNTKHGKDGNELRHLRALILAPTRELAMQVCSHLQAVAKSCGIWVVPIVGGIAAAKQERMLKAHPEIVVATPGRLWELMREGDPHLSDLSALSFLVLDEADRMVQQGHFEELSNILDLIPRPQSADAQEQATAIGFEDINTKDQAKPPKLQTFVFSATLTLPESLRKRLRKGGGGASGSVTLEGLMDKVPFRKKPKIADLTSERRLADKVTESYLECTEDDRDERLYYILAQHPGRTLIFANAISTVRRLAALLKLLQLPALALHASMQQRQRLKALDGFRAREDAILVATDVAARGLDIPGVKCIVHYQIPAAVDVYVHRCGRTARASAEGISVAMVAAKEMPRFSALLKALGQEAPPLFPLDQNLLPGARKRVRLAARLDEALRSSSKAAAHKSWEKQAAEAAEIELSEDEEGDSPAKPTAGGAGAAAIQQELAKLLQEPLQPRYNQRYFAGHPSAAIAGTLKGGEADGPGNQLQAVSQAVKHAKEKAEASRAASKAQDAADTASRKQQSKKQKSGKPSTRKAALAAAVAQQRAKKQVGKKSRLVVIPGAVGRQTQGPNALEALRQKLAVLNS